MSLKSWDSLFAFVLGGFGLVAIWLTSTLEYEYMLGQMDGNTPLSICNLPRAQDDSRDVYIPLCGILIAPLSLLGVTTLIRTGRVDARLLCGAVLTVFWTYRFFLRTAGC